MKFFKNTTFCLLDQAWVAATMCREWKGGDGTKTFEKHCFTWISNDNRRITPIRM